jgi:hypothetical protein
MHSSIVLVSVAAVLALLTGIVFRLWFKDDRLGFGEYVVVFAGWLPVAFFVAWIWRVVRRRRAA